MSSGLAINLHWWADKDTYPFISGCPRLSWWNLGNKVKDHEFGLPIIISVLFPCFLALFLEK